MSVVGARLDGVRRGRRRHESAGRRDRRPVTTTALATPRASFGARALGRVQTLIYVVIAVHIGVWIVSALYYDITQVRYVIAGHQVMYLKPGWDHLPKYLGFRTYAWWTA